MISPRRFALTRPVDDGDRQVVGYGMVLPDGKAYAVPWPTKRGKDTYHADSADQIADLSRTDIQWLGDES